MLGQFLATFGVLSNLWESSIRWQLLSACTSNFWTFTAFWARTIRLFDATTTRPQGPQTSHKPMLIGVLTVVCGWNVKYQPKLLPPTNNTGQKETRSAKRREAYKNQYTKNVRVFRELPETTLQRTERVNNDSERLEILSFGKAGNAERPRKTCLP